MLRISLSHDRHKHNMCERNTHSMCERDTCDMCVGDTHFMNERDARNIKNKKNGKMCFFNNM